MSVVVLAPHTDDAELGAGVTIAKLVERGNDVHVYAFSCGTSNTHEFNAAITELGARPYSFYFITREFSVNRQAILNCMLAINKEVSPRIVFAPAISDIHQDHQVITEEALRAFKHTTVYGMEFYWNSYNFHNDCYSVLSPDHIGKKLMALQKYESQKDRIYFKEDNILSALRFRGAQANAAYAECFQVFRQYL